MADKTIPAAPRTTPFDAEGNHLQEHGKRVPTSYMTVARKYGATPGLQVLTRLAARRGTPPAVVLYACDLPFVMDWRMTAEHARELAANLLKGADMCDRLGKL